MNIPWQFKFGLLLICCSVSVYSIKLIAIDNLKGTIEYIFNSFGFLFINVLMVTLVINELLTIRSRKQRLEKMNMVIGLFFTETGTRLLSLLVPCDDNYSELEMVMKIDPINTPDAKRMIRKLDEHVFSINPHKVQFELLRGFLSLHRDFLLRILENPVLLEHQKFTELLQATFHLTEELSRRKNLDNLPDTDILHLAGDISRVLRLLTSEWISYIIYLKKNYPYLYSLAVRTSPFDPKAIITVS